VKKVAIFINNLMGGGAERIVSYLLNEGYERFEMHLILLENQIAYEIPPPGKVRVYQLEGAKNSGISTVLKMKKLSRTLQHYLEEQKIDTLFSLLNRCNLLACRVKKNGWKGKLVISERADTLAHYKTVRYGWYMIRLVKKYYPYADAVTVISKGIAVSLSRLGIHNTQVIYNPIYSEAGPPVITERPFTFINVARLEPQKNQALLLHAFSKIPGNNSRLVILGIGFLEESLKKLASRLNIEDRVSFEGFQKDVNWWLARSDCFVFSSDYEGLGNVIIEALNAGLPVISTDCPAGPREILAPGSDPVNYIKNGIEYAPYGVLTPVGSEEYLAEAMQKMIDDEPMRQKYKLMAVPRSREFDLKQTVNKYFDLF
jgi:N-acetylgalactosamine-N,N'-diacetylbacillosaminyl-diphospho-undecaprenol 4-alpha-N-acetylgalactosaminyltransferase